ncbi:MAG: HAMP domain-containing sensor histidine kinase [Opitutaceae bacterium]|jgi:signal transduction histidine kinase
MNPFFKSIRWRLQLWHGALLLVVLTAFGMRLYSLHLQNRLQLIDQELQRQLIFVASTLQNTEHAEAIRDAATAALSGNQPLPAAPKDSVGQTGHEPRNNLPPEALHDSTKRALLDAITKAGTYYIGWGPDDTVMFKSELAPNDILPPTKNSNLLFHAQTRGECREQVLTSSSGLRLLVGRSLKGDLAQMRSVVWNTILSGAGVMALGLIGGWWMATRATKPIKTISATAQKIASGNLAERINVSDTDSELGQLAGILNASFDHVQKAVTELQDALERQTRFVADASHELRTPVAVVLAEASSALERERTPDEYREALGACCQTARRMRRLVESLLLLARVEAGRTSSPRAVCELDRVTRESVELLRSIANERPVALHLETRPTQCFGNSDELGQIVTNLVGNALHYNRPGGEVRVAVYSEAGVAVLRVEDTGQGIAEESLPHVFERFYRVDQSRSSTSGRFGLGLAITKALVEAHSGTITVTSVLGEGSVFTVRLPQAGTTAHMANAAQQHHDGGTFLLS